MFKKSRHRKAVKAYLKSLPDEKIDTLRELAIAVLEDRDIKMRPIWQWIFDMTNQEWMERFADKIISELEEDNKGQIDKIIKRVREETGEAAKKEIESIAKERAGKKAREKVEEKLKGTGLSKEVYEAVYEALFCKYHDEIYAEINQQIYKEDFAKIYEKEFDKRINEEKEIFIKESLKKI